MIRLASRIAAVALLTAPVAALAAPSAPVFSVTAKATKIGDGSTWQGDGGRQIAVAGNTVYVAFHGPNGEPSVARSVDGGLTWGNTAVLANDPVNGNPTGTVRVAVASDPLQAGKHIVCAAWGTYDSQIMYSYWVDRPTGAGWSAPVSISGATSGMAYSSSIALAAAPNGTVHVIFGDGAGNYHATAASGDAPFSEPERLPWGGGDHNVAVAFDAASNLYAVESHAIPDPDTGIWRSYVTFHKKLLASGAWSTVDVAVSDAAQEPGDNVSIAVYDASTVYVAFKQYPLNVDNAENHVWTAVSTDGGATWTKRIVAPNAAFYGTHPAIAVDAKKVVTLAAHYVEYGPNGRILVNRSTDDGASWSNSATVAGTQQVSLALDASGKALVSAVQNDLSPADEAFLAGSVDPGWNRRPIYFTRER